MKQIVLAICCLFFLWVWHYEHTENWRSSGTQNFQLPGNVEFANPIQVMRDTDTGDIWIYENKAWLHFSLIKTN
jgi:hypothetical protein